MNAETEKLIQRLHNSVFKGDRRDAIITLGMLGRTADSGAVQDVASQAYLLLRHDPVGDSHGDGRPIGQ